MSLFFFVVFSAVAILLVFQFAASLGKRMNRRTSAQVAEIIDKHIQGTEGPWDWDDFTTRPIADNRLDAIRVRCSELEYLSPPERTQELEQILERLRTVRAAE